MITKTIINLKALYIGLHNKSQIHQDRDITLLDRFIEKVNRS